MRAHSSITAILCALAAAPGAEAQTRTVIPLKEAKLNIEHNFTDKDHRTQLHRQGYRLSGRHRQ